MQLTARDLSIARGGRTVVDALSFEIAAGQAMVVTGPNGAGKTTLLRAVAGFLPILEGRVRLEGGPDEEAGIAEQCHYVGHRDGVKASLSVAENATFWSRYLGGNGDVGDALERVGLGALAGVPAAYLSAGQKRRLGLSRLIAANRPLWLLDEPTVSLDAAGVAMLAELIGEHRARGGLVLAATHLPLGIDDAHELRLGRAP